MVLSITDPFMTLNDISKVQELCFARLEVGLNMFVFVCVCDRELCGS